mmetsp:Transcript_1416/g.3055  ORF Transcript_1416/g.3055 Transcript_1416/m.3055 type:complete len:262 (-) Transcript_1416:14-799(-)
MSSIMLVNLLQTWLLFLSISSAYDIPSPPPAIVRHVRPQFTNVPRVVSTTVFLSALQSTAVSEATVPSAGGEIRSQGEQLRDSIPLATVRGRWRIRENRGPLMSVGGKGRICSSTVIFRGFVGDPNKGVVDYESTECGESSGGRWITKPTTRVRQLSARWKLKLPAGRFIYRGFIEAGSAVGRNGSVSAEMIGDILTGDNVGKEKKVGTFRADLMRSFDSTDVMIGEGSGAVIMLPKESLTSTETGNDSKSTTTNTRSADQ